MRLEGRYKSAIIEDLQRFRIRVVDGDDDARRLHGRVAKLAGAMGHHQPQVARVSAGEGEIVRAADGDGRMKGREALHAIVSSARARVCVVPATVEEVDVAARRESHRDAAAGGVVLVAALDDQPRMRWAAGRGADPRIELRREGAAGAVGAVTGIGDLGVGLALRAARGIVEGHVGRALEGGALIGGDELPLVASVEDHSVDPRRGGRGGAREAAGRVRRAPFGVKLGARDGADGAVI